MDDVDKLQRSAVRSRCRQVLGQLGIVKHPPQPLSVVNVRDRVQHQRGRPLHLIPVVTGPGWPSGMWVDTKHADLVLFDAATSALHTVNIIAHELGHIVLGHVGTLRNPAVNAMFRRLDAVGPAATMMWRTGFGDRDEHEAEVFATMVCARVGDRRTPAIVPAQDDPEGLIGRLLAAMADPLESK